MDSSKFLTSKEYNTIILNLFDSVTYINYPEECELIADKLFNMTYSDIKELTSAKEIKENRKIRNELINKPLTSKPIID
tara:strand:+ start:522 stop:758 length:237 start_codon:yes stop_codon:yes gene_type:complete